MSYVDKIRKIIKMRHDDIVSALAAGAVDNIQPAKQKGAR